VRRLGIDPEDELVERQHRHRRHVLPRHRDAGGERRGEQVGERDHQLVRVVARAFDVEEALAAGAARLVDDHHGLLHQIVLGDDALDHPRHLVGAAAGAGGDDELDVARGIPGQRRRAVQACGRRCREDNGDGTPFERLGHFAVLPMNHLLTLVGDFTWAALAVERRHAGKP